jgi:uncharacterized alpha-E superfamily protein
MLSRVAERIYWMARYVERAENTARLVEVHANLLLDLPRGILVGWEPLLQISGADELFFKHYKVCDERNVIKFLIADSFHPGSILSALSAARENVRTSRDIVPGAAIEQLNDLYLYARENANYGISRRRRYEFLEKIVTGSQLITGVLSGTMSRDEAYDLVRLGRNLERADMSTRILDARSANLLRGVAEELSPFESIQWMSVLKSLSGYQMYRRHVRLRVNGFDVLRFALKSPIFPRSVYFCIGEGEKCLRKLPRNEGPLRSVVRLKRIVDEVEIGDLLEQARLHKFIDALQVGLNLAHDQISATYFSSADSAGSSQAA